MKSITESFKDTISISAMVEESRVDEGLKDILKLVKDKFKQAYQYLKNIVVKAGTYFLPVDNKGKVIPAITPLTSGQAYKDGEINKSNTTVCLDKAGQKIVGLYTKAGDVLKMYGKESSIKYWERTINESEEAEIANVNEVKIEADDPEAKWNRIADDKELLMEIQMCIDNPKDAKLMIWGAPGIGKTAIVQEVVKNMLKKHPIYNLIFKTLSNETPDNFTLPKYIDVNGEDYATDVPKTWLPVYKPTGDAAIDKERDAAVGEGLLFIDELSRATPQVLNVVLPLVNEGAFNGYKLGSGWSIICASNRAEDEMSGQTTIGNALGNRFVQVFYEPTVKSWKRWAEQQNFISPLLLSWLEMPASENMSGAKFFYMDPNENSDIPNPTTLMCTPRSWTNAMRRLARYSHTGTLEGFTIFDIPTRVIGRALNGCIPTSAVDSFIAFLEVIKNIGNFDGAVNDVWENGGKGFKVDKKSLNKITLPLAQLIVNAHANELPTEEEFSNLADWLVSQNSDQLASYVLDVFKNVFMGMLDDEKRDAIFVIGKKLEKYPDKAAAYTAICQPFLTRWGIKMEEIPVYSTGLKKISEKYQAIFKSSVVDGKEALG